MFIELHGFTKPHEDYPDIIFGNLFGTTLKIIDESDLRNIKKYWGFTEMIEFLSKNFTLDDGLGMTDFNLGYSGGYIIHQFYKRNLSNAFQIEVSKHIREMRLLTKTFIDGFVSAITNCLKDK